MQIMAETSDCRVYDIAQVLLLTTGGVNIELSPAGTTELEKARETFELELEARIAGAGWERQEKTQDGTA
jgi:hypothetical protein